MGKFYITTAIDYVNDTIHIGHAFQKLVADILARYQRVKIGKENVFFLTGTDEYGQKAERAAKESNLSSREFADRISESDKKEQDCLNISYDRFIRTTDPDHADVVQEIWRRIDKAGDIYLGEYTGLYCEGCEAYYTEEDLIDGHCPFHLTLQIKKVTEKNYFFRWSKYRDFLVNHIESNPEFIIPEKRKNEMLEFAKKIRDIPISRSNFKWGISVPNDPEQVIYVWFDALVNYLTGVNFLEDSEKFNKFWPADVHVLGKDNARWHALLWPAMLHSAGIKLPKTILVNGFLSLNGQKISKSIGNIIRPSDWVKEFGVDAVRYYLIGHTNITEDSDISKDKLIAAYNSDLANGLGNLFERVFTIILDHDINIGTLRETEISKKAEEVQKQYDDYFNKYNPSEALRVIFAFTKDLDRYINNVKPWTQDFWGQAENELILNSLFFGIEKIVGWTEPFLPDAAKRAQLYIERIKNKKIGKDERLGLFPRISKS